MRDIHPKEKLRRVLNEFRAMKQGENRLAQNIPCVRKDGTRIYANINSTQVVIDGFECIVGFFQDITQRVKTEEALRESEEKYRNILESIEDGYFEVDLAGNLTLANNAAQRMMGYSLEELIGMNNQEFTSHKTAKKMFQVFNTVYNARKPVDVVNFEIITKDGNIKNLELSASLMQDSEQTPIGALILRLAAKRIPCFCQCFCNSSYTASPTPKRMKLISSEVLVRGIRFLEYQTCRWHLPINFGLPYSLVISQDAPVGFKPPKEIRSPPFRLL